MIFFCHIHRTAGSTIHSSFLSHFTESKARYLVVSGTGDLPAAAATVAGLPDRRYYLGGHVGLHDLLNAGIQVLDSDIVFATTRDPVERAVSLYFLLQRSPDWFPPDQRRLAGSSFPYFYEFLRDNGYYFRNDHCRLISGSERFEVTLDCIEQRFNLLGSSSRMSLLEAALMRLCASVAPGFRITPFRENAAYHKQTQPDRWERRATIQDVVGTDFIDRIYRDNEQDLILVDFVEHTHGGLFLANNSASPSSRAGTQAMAASSALRQNDPAKRF